MLSVNPLVAGDESALQELFESVPAYAEQITGYPPGPSDGLSALISVPSGFDPASKLSLGLWDDDVLVAFADVLLRYPDERRAYVGLLFVRGGMHRQGLGRAIHDAVVRTVLGESGVTDLRIGIIDVVAYGVEPFWRSMGYLPTGERKPYRYGQIESGVALWERTIS